MNIKEFAEPSGLICGIHYHDQILEAFVAFERRCNIEIVTSDGPHIRLEFSGIFSSSVRKFLPGTIILSMFLWGIENVPSWFATNSQYTECWEDGPVTSKFLFFLESSFGASVCVLFDTLQVFNSKEQGTIFEIS